MEVYQSKIVCLQIQKCNPSYQKGFRCRDLAIRLPVFLDRKLSSEMGRKKDNFGPFYTILAILDNFGRALNVKKDGQFEILAKSLFGLHLCCDEKMAYVRLQF